MENREKEISLLDMLLYICQRWRSLIICLVIGAVVFGAYGWFKSGNVSDSQTETIVSEDVDGVPLDEVKWEKVLTPREISFVEQGVEYWKRFQEIQKEPENPVNPESKEVYISKWTYYTSEIDARIKLQNYLDKFSENQWKYFRFLTGDIIEKNENIAVDVPTAKRTISFKYIVIGAFLGLVIAAIILAIKYIVTKTIKTVYDLEEGFGFQILGVFDNETEFDKKHKTKIDKALRKARRKNKHKLDFDENVELTATKIQIAAEKSNLSNICLITDIENDCNLMDTIVNKLSGNLNITVIKNVLAKADALQDMAKMDGAVLVEQIEVSTDKDIHDECLLCSKYGINIIGTIVLE